MNHIYRLVFNRSLGVLQAVGELTRPRAGALSSGGGKRSGSLAVGAVLGVAMLVSSTSALADFNGGTRANGAGTGGSGSFLGGGGAGGAGNGYADPYSFAGVNGAGSTGVAAYGGSPGGAGGSVGTTITTSNVTVSTPTTGGAGGDATAPGAGGGGGGSAVFVNSGSNTGIGISSVALTGGRGGIGAGGGGGGGGGGAGLMIAQGVNVTTSATITGGTGGAGGSAGGGGGGGGAGVYLAGNYAEVLQHGVVTGGSGGAGADGGGAGRAGAGITAENGDNYVINYNVISGGLNSDGTRAHAIDFYGDANYLVLAGGSSLVGDAVATGNGNTLALDGTGIANNNFSGFNILQANPSSNWTINGIFARTASTTANLGAGSVISLTQALTGAQPLYLSGTGTLKLAATSNYSGATSVDLATLESSGDFVTTGALTNNGNVVMDGHQLSVGTLSGSYTGAGISGASAITLSDTGTNGYAGSLSTTGNFNKNGTGVLTLTGTAAVGGIVNVGNGTLQIGDGGTSGDLNTASVMGFGSGNLWFNRSDDVTFTGNIAEAHVAQVGSGTLTLSGNNTPNFVDISRGTLRLGSPLALLGAIVTVGDGTAFDFGSSDASLDNTFVLRGNTRFNVIAGVSGTLTGAVPQGMSGSSLTKTGGGALALDGPTGYTGVTDVQAGTFIVGSTSGSTATLNGEVLAENGTTLGGFGTIANTVTVSGATLSPGMDQIGTLTVGGLIVQGGRIAVDLGAPGSGDVLNVTGDASFSDATVNVNDAGDMGLGVYRFVTVGGAIQDSDLTLGSTPANSRMVLRYIAADHAFDLLNLGDAVLNFWNGNGLASSTQAGGGAGTWALNSPTFTDANGAVSDAMYPAPGFAVFAGQAGQVQVSDTQGNVAATGLQFMSDGYTMSGDALALVADSDGVAPVIRVGDGTAQGATVTATIANVLTGTDGLRKTDAGTLVLNGQNTFSGGVSIDGGTLAIGSDANLGDAGNTIAFHGGTLRVTNALDTARNVMLGTAGGTLALEADVALSGTISGDGGLHKTGMGTLSLSGTNSYTGGTWLDAGLIQIGADSAIGTGTLHMAEGTSLGLLGTNLNVANAIVATGDPTVEVAAGNQATLSGVISDGTVAGDIVKTGSGTLRLTGENTYTGGTVVNAGTLIVGDGSTHGSIVGNVLNNGTLAFDRSDAVTFAGALSGDGTVQKLGSNTLTLSGDSSAFSGTTQIQGGTLDVIGSLGGTLSIAPNATLTGTGRLGTVSIGNTSTLDPGGNSAIGQFAVAGNLAIANGATYVVNTTAAGFSDAVIVAGVASLAGGTVKSLQDGGSYRPQSRFTILTANGGVSGTFGGVTSNLAFLTPTLAYDANHVYLDLARNDIRFAELAQNRNQAATAVAVESQGFGAPVYDAVVGLSADAVPPALDTLAGASIASARTALINDARQVRDAVQRHVLDNGALGLDVNGVWTSAWGHWADTRGSEGAVRQTSDGSGLLVGADRDLDGLTLGVLGASGNLTARSGSADVQSKSTVAGLYVATTAGAWQWQAGATYAWDRLESHRRVAVAGLAGVASARYDANVAQAYVDGGYRFDFTSGSLSPFVNMARVQVSQDSLTERGTAAGLAARGQHDGVTLGTAGLRGVVKLGEAVSAHATLGYQHAWGDLRPMDAQRFVSGGDSFTVAGVPVAKNSGVVDTGITFVIARNATIDASYHGVFGGDAKDQGARMGLTVKW